MTISADSTFQAGEEIVVTVEVNNTTPQVGTPPKQGFELSARDADLNNVGSFIVNGTSVKLTNSDPNYVTHATPTETSWTFRWVAPTENVPDEVTFYVAGNASNSNFSPDAGDMIYTATHTLTRDMGTAGEPQAMPLALELGAVYPNPFRYETHATFTLARAGTVTAVLRDGRGRAVRVLEEGPHAAGEHTLSISADGLASGLYFLTVSSPDGVLTQPLTLVR